MAQTKFFRARKKVVRLSESEVMRKLDLIREKAQKLDARQLEQLNYVLTKTWDIIEKMEYHNG